ncbi:thiamine pyrophosphate-dependent enzyme [Poseidonocella sp. HB161398]|uniref:thiamine pyrophosphate-dependent enzyme n=1 Tax=Poseidonocella sp. HB161398 TaxID=2320855 RepID=UPI001F102D8D|nr:thiamine pyrophosphate-dependent enzyme [Poseidonocella sp. HB161398]
MNVQDTAAPVRQRGPQGMAARARAIAEAGGLAAARARGLLPELLELTLSEALVLALLKQGTRKYLAIFGHGSTDLGEVLRIYDGAGVTRTFNFRNEVEMAHAATALAWQYGETPALITSIGPGALQAMAGSLAAASNGVGVWHIYGDETTFGEGYNMQQIPKPEQELYARMSALMGQSYMLHTPEALREAMRRGSRRVHDPVKAGPFYLHLPINTQPARALFNLDALPERPAAEPLSPETNDSIEAAARLIAQTGRVVLKAGGGTRGFDTEIRALARAAGAAVVLSPGSTGVMADADPQNMHVGGSKGSLSGNFAMEEAELLIVAGSRAVCQADCSGTGYPKVRHVVNLNADWADALHYNRTLSLLGDLGAVAKRLAAALESCEAAPGKADWLAACAAKKRAWAGFRAERLTLPPVRDAVWGTEVLAQPAAIGIVDAFAREHGAVKYFDAGDVQANGFQIVADDRSGQTYTETGASYMGFASSGILASALADRPDYVIAFTGDGSFMMNPQVLIDAVEHGLKGMVAIFDNRRMAAISSLQMAQYGTDFRTNDGVPVDYAAMAGSVAGVFARRVAGTAEDLRAALAEGHAHDGLSVLHVPVYSGEDPRGGMGSWGSWNVGNWVEDVQGRWMRQSL